MRNILIIFLLTTAVSVNGQDYQKEYLQGKSFLKDQKYGLAMEAFKPLVKADNDSPLAKYAMYFYSLAAYKDGYPALAKDMLLQIKELYPDWEQMDEVQLWLARIYFEDNKYNQAINSLKQVDERELTKQKEALKKFYLYQLEDVITLGQLYESNPKDAIIARQYARTLSNQPLVGGNQELLTEIISEFKFNPEEFNAGIVTETIHKEKYKVAVMLPFVHESLDVNIRKKKNQFVLDMYHGIRMAVEQLNERGVDIEIYAYDTRRDYATTKAILNKEELKAMDAIIGPLYPEPIKLVQEFAFQNKINVINPISNNPVGLESNPFYFLFKPSYKTMGTAMAEYALDEIDNPYGIILYGESEADLILANAYKETFEKDSIHKIVMMEKIPTGNPRRVLDILTTAGTKLSNASDEEEEVKLTIPHDSIGSVYVASDEGLIITRVLSGIETRKDTIRIFGSDRWLDIKAIDFAALERLKVAMVAPSYYDYRKQEFQDFREKYVHIHKDLPSEFAITGYDATMFIGTALKKHGKYFQVGMSTSPTQEGFLYAGYNYSMSTDNQVVPIVRVINNEPKIVVIKNYATDKQE